MKLITQTYHIHLLNDNCIVKEWVTLFGKRLFVIRKRPATREDKLRSLNHF